MPLSRIMSIEILFPLKALSSNLSDEMEWMITNRNHNQTETNKPSSLFNVITISILTLFWKQYLQKGFYGENERAKETMLLAFRGMELMLRIFDNIVRSWFLLSIVEANNGIFCVFGGSTSNGKPFCTFLFLFKISIFRKLKFLRVIY